MTASSAVFQAEQTDGVVVLHVLHEVGSLAHLNIWEELSTVLEQVELDPPVHVVADFANAPWFGSAMMEALLRIWQMVEPQGGSLSLCQLSPVAREVIEIANYQRIWPVYDTIADAITAINAT